MQIQKKHIFTIVLAAVFILPVAVFPRDTGQVLGINETVSVETNSNTLQDIASGVRDVVNQKKETKTLSGKALWDSKQKVQVSTNKFESGSLIEIKYNDKVQTFLVEAQRNDLTEETVVILNTEAFLLLGVDPELKSIIDVEVNLVT